MGSELGLGSELGSGLELGLGLGLRLCEGSEGSGYFFSASLKCTKPSSSVPNCFITEDSNWAFLVCRWVRVRVRGRVWGWGRVWG